MRCCARHACSRAAPARGALAFAIVAGAAAAAEVPRSRAEIALSFAPVVREAAPAVVNICACKGRNLRSFFESFHPLPGRLEIERIAARRAAGSHDPGRRLAVVIGG